MSVVLGICNPLLDISAEVPKELLEKYELKPSNAILADPKHLPLYDELVKNHSVTYIAGGAGQNSVRACQWMIGERGATAYLGCVGDDEYGRTLKERALADGVDVHYAVSPSAPTGTCAVLIVEKDRSMVANLGAANHYPPSHLEHEDRQTLMQDAKFFVATGFFLTVAPQCLVTIGKHAAENNKPFVLNVGAPFIFDFFLTQLLDTLPYVDYLIGNKEEILALGGKLEYGTDVEEIIKKLSQYQKVNAARPRTVICTQGADSAVAFTGESIVTVPAIRVPDDQIVDLNGAGDSFVGGFLAGLVRNKSLEEAIRAGHYTASVTVRTSGTQFTGSPSFEWSQ